MPYKQLAEKLNQLSEKFKFDKEFQFLLCVIDIYSKYVWVLPIKDAKVVTITDAFQKNLDESWGKGKKIWIHKGSEVYKRSMKS